jgi:hypothetical protein
MQTNKLELDIFLFLKSYFVTIVLFFANSWLDISSYKNLSLVFVYIIGVRI